MRNLLYIFVFLPFTLFSQVGINTTTPTETLHVEGTLCVTDTTTKTATKIAGLDANGTVAGINVGNGVELNGNVLNSTATGSTYHFVATISLPGGTPGKDYNNLDLDLSGANASSTLFRLTDRTAGYDITGISGGTDGRHIVLFNVSSSNLKIYDEDSRSTDKNRIITLAGVFVSTSGQGTAQLVYDGALERWILIGFRD